MLSKDIRNTVSVFMVISLLATAFVPCAGANSWPSTFYFFDYAYVVASYNQSSGYFDIPVNYSDGTLNQTVLVTALGGETRVSNDSRITIDLFNGSNGYVILKIHQSIRNTTDAIITMLSDPEAFNYSDQDIPPDIREKYVNIPAKIVVDVVKTDFEEWLSKEGISVNDVSKAFLAAKAAFFIYSTGYITYSAAAMPRSLEEVINEKKGDCDDMSRVLVNLLWSYGIPAKIEQGYVYLPYNQTIEFEGSYLTFINAGPHGYVLTYVPNIGWVSLDFLAGARIFLPVLVTGETTQANITSQDINEIREELSKIRYAEIIMTFDEDNVPDYLLEAMNSGTIQETLHSMIEENIRKIMANLSTELPNTTPTSTTSPTTTNTWQTTEATPVNNISTTEQPEKTIIDATVFILLTTALAIIIMSLIITRKDLS